MNYRHAFHAGNHADVFKHALLVRLIAALQRKEAGFLFLETHAGRGAYELGSASRGETRTRQPEWPEGIGRLWGLSDAEAPNDYLGLVREFDRSQGGTGASPAHYPGSPRIAKAMARAQDRISLWERHPEECGALRQEFDLEKRVSITEGDGYMALRASLPPPERRALVLIDPPYEDAAEWERVQDAAREGLERHPAAVIAIWYPLTARSGSELFLGGVGDLGAPCLSAEVVVDPASEGLRGSGVAVLNPPWKFDAEASGLARYLARLLGRTEGACGALRWLAAE